jgi:hypothetical protein
MDLLIPPRRLAPPLRAGPRPRRRPGRARVLITVAAASTLLLGECPARWSEVRERPSARTEATAVRHRPAATARPPVDLESAAREASQPPGQDAGD